MKNYSITTTAFLILCVLFLNSCSFSEWNIDELYQQKIEGTSKILYKYSASGGRDSMTEGYILLDSTETFEVDLNGDLGFYYLANIPNSKTIIGVNHECANSCDKEYQTAKPLFSPIKSRKDKFENIEVEIISFQYKGFAEREEGLQTFHFENFKETRDSLYFYDLDDVESTDGIHLDNLAFKKTDVVIFQNKKSQIRQIVIENVVLNKSKEIQKLQTYFLTPKRKISISSFSDYGIFKEVIR